MNTTLRRKGQTLAEFALTLPFLLALTFGVVEFGRIFQSWVTLQNSAREAVRYATTGLYDEEKYDLDVLLPCEADTAYGTLGKTKFSTKGPTVEWSALDHANKTMADGDLFRTLYDGQKCDPGGNDDRNKRQDILRIASIMDRARIGASGLSLEDNPLDGSRQSLEQMFFNLWSLPRPRSTSPGYFDVSICSTRPFLNDSTPEDVNKNSTVDDEDYAPRRIDDTLGTRFKTIFDEESLQNVPKEFHHDFPLPYCMLNEIQPKDLRDSGKITDNGGIPWLDPGGSGERVSVFVTYNHPLITPLGLAEYITMQAWRSGVNESFRASNAQSAVSGPPPGLDKVEPPTPIPDTATYTPSHTPTSTPSASPTASRTHTPTPGPFECDNLVFSDLRLLGQKVFIDILNQNFQASTLERVEMKWSTPPSESLYVLAQAINDEVFWTGTRDVSPFDTNDFTAAERAIFLNADRTIPGQDEISTWEAAYFGAGFNLASVLNPWDFSGTTFHFSNPQKPGEFCRVEYIFPPDEIPPPIPPGVIPSATYTPNCASSSLKVEFVSFDSFGAVQLRITNNRFQSAPFLGFSISWPDPASYKPSLAGTLTLNKITVGGVNPDDSQGLLLWRGRDDWGDGKNNGDREPRTTHTEGVFWRSGYKFPPNQPTTLWLDFDGTSGKLNTEPFFINGSHFNGSQFNIGCGGSSGGDGDGGGSSDDGDIFLSTVEPPGPTNTPRPTRTPGPTRTPSPTRPSPTPSKTRTPGPTQTPSQTPTHTSIPPPQPPTAPPDQGGSGSE